MSGLVFEVRSTIRRQYDRRLLAKIAATCSREWPAVRGRVISIALVGDVTMARLNRQYRHKSGVTDVLSFPQESDVLPSGDDTLLGEIIIDYPQVIRQAKKYHKPVAAEFALLVIHGVIHLLGHDHERSAREAKRFDAWHTKLLKQLGFSTRI